MGDFKLNILCATMGKTEPKETGQKRITDFTVTKEKARKDNSFVCDKQRSGTSVDLCSAEVSEDYWKELFKERDKALNDTLEENKDISELIQIRKTEIETIMKENETLRDENAVLAQKASKMDGLIETLTELLPE